MSVSSQIVAGEEIVERGAQLAPHQGGQLRAQHDAEAVVLDVPTHDVLGVGPTMLADRHDLAPRPAEPVAAARVAQHDRGRAVAEQRDGDEIGDAHVVAARAQAAQIDGEEEHVAARHGLGDADRTRQPANAAAAAETEDRQALDLAREGQTVDEARLEARNRQAGDGVDHDGADVCERDAGSGHGFERGFLQQRQRMALEGGRPLLPARGSRVPVGRLADVSALDAGVGEHARYSGQMREEALAGFRDGVLQNLVLRDGASRRMQSRRRTVPRFRHMADVLLFPARTSPPVGSGEPSHQIDGQFRPLFGLS